MRRAMSWGGAMLLILAACGGGDATETTTTTTPDTSTLTTTTTLPASTTTDCNTFRGTYTVDGNQIKIDLPISTRMACPDDAQEAAYVQDLTAVQSYLMSDGNLVMELPFDSGGMIFAPAAQ